MRAHVDGTRGLAYSEFIENVIRFYTSALHVDLLHHSHPVSPTTENVINVTPNASDMRYQQENSLMEITLSEQTRLSLVRGAYTCTPEEFTSFEALMHSATPTPNTYRPSTNILRQQCAVFLPAAPVHTYEFGQKQDSIVSEIDDMHPLLARVFSSMPPEYNMVQCNYYEHAGVGITSHRDNEPCIDPRYPIRSVTFRLNPEDVRKFSLYTLDGHKVLDVVLGHGDLLTMHGQNEYKHGIEKERRTACGPRLNFTFRVAI